MVIFHNCPNQWVKQTAMVSKQDFLSSNIDCVHFILGIKMRKINKSLIALICMTTGNQYFKIMKALDVWKMGTLYFMTIQPTAI